MELDQYYTKPSVASWCLDRLFETLPSAEKRHFIEPSAGNGSFFSLLPKSQRTGVDLEPRMNGIERADFLSWYPTKKASRNNVIVGNPPFGKRSKLAIDFFNHAAVMADTIAFIVPRQFQKYSVHSKLNTEFRLVGDFLLEENSFYTPDGRDFGARCVFQVWTRQTTPHQNLRILSAPPTTHPDFQMYQYNNTPEALKYFRFDWDFAVPRQGYEDYTRREQRAERCEKNKQWIMFKAATHMIRDRLYHFDFFDLAKRNTTVYGFGKADVVDAYNRVYGS